MGVKKGRCFYNGKSLLEEAGREWMKKHKKEIRERNEILKKKLEKAGFKV